MRIVATASDKKTRKAKVVEAHALILHGREPAIAPSNELEICSSRATVSLEIGFRGLRML